MKKVLLACIMFSAAVFAADGATLYKKCVACHGAKAEKKFQNRVPALNTLSKEELVKALNDYKTGANKYGIGAMMKPVAAPLSSDDINALADYITSIK